VYANALSFTILGAAGFIGSAVRSHLESQGHITHAITRASMPALLASREHVGHVIDCVGLTGDFRDRPLETAEAHVGIVARCLAELHFTSFLLLSSTRVYARAEVTREDAALPTVPEDRSDLYNVTKLAGEALCLADRRPTIRVARLSNVYGVGMPEQTFLGQVLREGLRTGDVVFHQSGESEKDYVSVATVAAMLPAIATRGHHRLYNVGAGCNTSHAAIAEKLRAVAGWRTSFAEGVPTVRQLRIDVTRLTAEFGPVRCDLSADLPTMLALALEKPC
jgi:nucleoside-diphosphate-sugar epimerase